MSMLTSLKMLNVSNNKLSMIPQGLHNSPHLVVLDLSINRIKEIKPYVKLLGEFPCYFYWGSVVIDADALTEQPIHTIILSDDVETLVSLRQLHLSDNEIVDVPPEIGELVNLEVVSAY